jgi:hypothetical protein
MPASRSPDDHDGADLVGELPEPEPDQAATMTAIALAESSGSTGSTGEDSRGLWQINAEARTTAPGAVADVDPGAALDGLDATSAQPVVVESEVDVLAAFGAPVHDGDLPAGRHGDVGLARPGEPAAAPELDDEVLIAFVGGSAASSPEPNVYEADPLADAPDAGVADDVDGLDRIVEPAGWSITQELED